MFGLWACVVFAGSLAVMGYVGFVASAAACWVHVVAWCVDVGVVGSVVGRGGG